MVTFGAPANVKATSVAASIWPALFPGSACVSAFAMCTFWKSTAVEPFWLLS
jgi:hypothetical protein